MSVKPVTKTNHWLEVLAKLFNFYWKILKEVGLAFIEIPLIGFFALYFL